jgi:hypothetical protein
MKCFLTCNSKRTNDFSQIMEIYVLLDSKSISNNYTQR